MKGHEIGHESGVIVTARGAFFLVAGEVAGIVTDATGAATAGDDRTTGTVTAVGETGGTELMQTRETERRLAKIRVRATLTWRSTSRRKSTRKSLLNAGGGSAKSC
jgi:hypothetical protein